MHTTITRTTSQRRGVTWHWTVLTALTLAVGCGGSRQSAWESSGAARTGGRGNTPTTETAAQSAERGWQARSDEAKLRESISAWNAVVTTHPDDAASWTKLSRASYFLADAFLAFDPSKRDEMLATYEQGTQAAERALMTLSPEFAQRMRAQTRLEDAVSSLGVDAVPAMYWRSANLGKWAAAQGFATQLAYKDEVRAIMTRCLTLDASYFYGGPHRYFGAFFARAPSYAGGDLNRSREHFEQSLAIAPDYFATRVLYAQDYAVKAQDRATFDAQLAYVLGHEPASLEDAAPENAVEQRKARELQGRADDLFEP